jgi:hypothetical protein
LAAELIVFQREVRMGTTNAASDKAVVNVLGKVGTPTWSALTQDKLVPIATSAPKNACEVA